MAINFTRPGETQLSGPPIGKAANSPKSNPSALDNTAQNSAQPRGDSVQISSSALQMQSLSEKLSSAPDIVDAEKVERLKQAVEDGSYSIDSRQVADKMLRFEALL